MSEQPGRSPTTPPMGHNFDQTNLIRGPQRRERSFFQRRRNPFNVSIPFQLPHEVRRRQPDQQNPTTPPMMDNFENRGLNSRPERRRRSFAQSRRNALLLPIPIHLSPLSPTTPSMRNNFEREDLTLGPRRRQRSLSQNRKDSFRVAIPFNIDSASLEESRQQRLQRLRASVSESFFQEQRVEENNIQRNSDTFVGTEEKQEAADEAAEPVINKIINEVRERKEKRQKYLQKHVDRLKRAEMTKKRGGPSNMPGNVYFRQQKVSSNLAQINNARLNRLIDLAGAAGVVKRQAVRPRISIFGTSFEERERVRNQIALRQIQKLRNEADERLPEKRHENLIPLATNLNSDGAENEENELLEKEIKMSIGTFCKGYERMTERRLRSDFIFNNLKKSLENIFDNIFLIRTRYRGAAFRENKLLRQNLISEILVYFATSPPLEESFYKMIEIFKKLKFKIAVDFSRQKPLQIFSVKQKAFGIMMKGKDVEDMFIPLLRRDVQKMILNRVVRNIMKHPLRRFQPHPALPRFARESIVKKYISPLLLHSLEASKMNEDDGESDESSIKSETATQPSLESKVPTTPAMPHQTEKKIFEKLWGEHYEEARKKMHKRASHSDLRVIGELQARALIPYLRTKAEKDFPYKIHEEWLKTPEGKKHEKETRKHEELEKFISETLTPQTAMQFARSANVKLFFVMPPMTSSVERETEKEIISARIEKDVTLLCAFRYVMLNEKDYEEEDIVANLKESVRKILRNISLVKTHFQTELNVEDLVAQNAFVNRVMKYLQESLDPESSQTEESRFTKLKELFEQFAKPQKATKNSRIPSKISRVPVPFTLQNFPKVEVAPKVDGLKLKAPMRAMPTAPKAVLLPRLNKVPAGRNIEEKTVNVHQVEPFRYVEGLQVPDDVIERDILYVATQLVDKFSEDLPVLNDKLTSTIIGVARKFKSRVYTKNVALKMTKHILSIVPCVPIDFLKTFVYHVQNEFFDEIEFGSPVLNANVRAQALTNKQKSKCEEQKGNEIVDNQAQLNTFLNLHDDDLDKIAHMLDNRTKKKLEYSTEKLTGNVTISGGEKSNTGDDLLAVPMKINGLMRHEIGDGYERMIGGLPSASITGDVINDEISQMDQRLERQGQELNHLENSQIKVLKYVLEPTALDRQNFWQSRGADIPIWFPGFYTVFQDSFNLKPTAQASPSSIFLHAWRTMAPIAETREL